jgi:hypothetical protein
VKAKSQALDDLQIALQIQRLIASFGDSHTVVNYSRFIDKNKVLPLHLYWFSDGLFILHSTPGNAEILGHQILSINGFPIQTVIDSVNTLITVDNRSIVKSEVPKILPLLQVLEFFGFVNTEPVELTLKNGQGIVREYRIKPAELIREHRVSYKPDSLALCYRNERFLFVDHYLSTDKIYYLQYNKCWSRELELQYGNPANAGKLPSFKEFEERVYRTLESVTVDKIVFDLRFNGGGNSQQGTDFIERLAKYLQSHQDKKVYVIIGRNTFSSAVLNAMDFKRLLNTTFVGEETGGKPNHFGETKRLVLPSSGVPVIYSTKYFKRVDQDLKTISPDIGQEASSLDFTRGIDPAYEWIKRQ